MVTREGKCRWCGVHREFDDAQTGVKKIFPTRDQCQLGPFTSGSRRQFNYWTAGTTGCLLFYRYEEMVSAGKVELGGLSRSASHRNFGNILGAYYAIRCGLPVSRLICASNRNNVLSDFIRTGTYDRRREFHKTESPSMDILNLVQRSNAAV